MAPWFGPKKLGVGVGPRTWQGYLVCALGVAGMIVLAAVVRLVAR